MKVQRKNAESVHGVGIMTSVTLDQLMTTRLMTCRTLWDVCDDTNGHHIFRSYLHLTLILKTYSEDGVLNLPINKSQMKSIHKQRNSYADTAYAMIYSSNSLPLTVQQYKDISVT